MHTDFIDSKDFMRRINLEMKIKLDNCAKEVPSHILSPKVILVTKMERLVVLGCVYFRIRSIYLVYPVSPSPSCGE